MATVGRITSTRRATVGDLYRAQGKAELVNGKILKMSPTGKRPGRIGLNIALSLRAFETVTRQGEAYPDNVAFLCNLPNRGSFSPDASYYTGPQPADLDDFLPNAPDFAAEIRSKGDYGRAAERKLMAKRRDYFAAGTKVVWDVDVLKKIVRVYRATDPDRATIYRSGQIAEAEPAVPGWRMAVNEIFA
jgi:Uma2 family endonuclease